MGLYDALQFVVIALYLAGTALFLAGFAAEKERLRVAGAWASVAGFAMHTLDLALFVAMSKNAVLSSGQFYFSLLAWSMLVIYFLIWWRLKLRFMALTAAPFALVLFLSSLAAASLKVKMPPLLSGLFLGLHIGSLFISLALLTMAFGAALAFIYLENRIKRKTRPSGLDREMPSLNTFDKVNYWAIVVGFPCYTLGLISGFVWARLTWGRIFSWDPKEVAALAVWFLYAFLFHQRLAMGWRGRKTASLVMWIFIISIISLAGINFLVPTHHSFKP